MPIYEFHCRACGIHFEELVSVSAEEPPPCPRCRKSNDVERSVSGFSIRPHGKPMTYNRMRKKAYGKGS
jgi:putative FmdB family regulatory protein